MRSNYKPIGEIVRRVDERNSNNSTAVLVGLSIDKCFINSVANTIGTDLSKYKIIRRRDFAVSLMQVSRDQKIPIAMQDDYDVAIMSPAYSIFRVIDESVIIPEYLEMWFKRPEFDREASFIAVGGVRGSMPWEDFAKMKVPVPSYEKQKEIVESYRVISERMELKKRINDNLTNQLVAFNKLLCAGLDQNASISDYCNRIYSGGTPSTAVDEYWFGSNPWLSSGETSNDYITKTFKHISDDAVLNSSTKLAQKGSIVVASAGQGLTRGQTSYLFIDTYVNQSVIVLEPKPGFAGFVYSNLKGRYEEMRNISDLDSIRGSLTTKSLGSLPIPVFSHDDVSSFEKRCFASFQIINKNLLEIESLQTLLTVLMSNLSSR